MNDRGKQRISPWSLRFTSKGVEAKYRSYSQRIAQFPLSVLGWGLLLPVGFQAYVSRVSALRLKQLLDSCSPSMLLGECFSCQMTVTYGLGASTFFLLFALATPKTFVRTRSFLFSAVFVLVLLLNVTSTICPGTCVDAQGDIVFGPLLPANELACLQTPESVSASAWVYSTLPFWLTSGTVSAYVILAATTLMLRHALTFGSLVLLVLIFTQGYASANTASYLSTMTFAIFEVLVKSTLATYQRELITRISFFLNVRRSGLQRHIDAVAAARQQPNPRGSKSPRRSKLPSYHRLCQTRAEFCHTTFPTRADRLTSRLQPTSLRASTVTLSTSTACSTRCHASARDYRRIHEHPTTASNNAANW
ncbi:hypothetical protein BCR44DRAFT_1195533 [Catenaria anguillulae PL171]|uniref:Uncharacterized protein n=1 Tax=Catenaria anguillulae PL171 TaxID=765915 RepID=A0A1Y2HIJ4_9FUNG|nr:hypothetical protein BCR44DRAFT_1195533 [Catenaria anguillulae PL171]